MSRHFIAAPHRVMFFGRSVDAGFWYVVISIFYSGRTLWLFEKETHPKSIFRMAGKGEIGHQFVSDLPSAMAPMTGHGLAQRFPNQC